MPARRAAPWIALALLLLAAASPARAEGPPGPRIVAARAEPTGGAELIVACPAGDSTDLSLSVDGGPFAPPGSAERADAPPSLTIIVERGAGMALAGTPHSTSADDALGQAELLLARLPLGSRVAAVGYGERAELLAPLGGDLAGARAALAAGLRDLPADPPAEGALSAAVGLARDQLRDAPAGPQALVILAADGPGEGEALPEPGDNTVAITVVGLSDAGEAGMRAAAERMGAAYLPYHSEDLAALPGLLDALGARYAEMIAPGALLRATTADPLPPGRHQIALKGCGGSAEAWVSASAAAPGIDWRLSALAGAGGLSLGMLVGRLGVGGWGLGVGGRGRTPTPDSRPPTPGRGEEAETERGARRLPEPARPVYRLVAWAGERRITHEMRERQCVIGRDPGCDLQIDGPSVSNLHARLTVADGQITLADLDSGSGTSLGPGGPRLVAHLPTEIRDGDEFWLGPEVRVALRKD
ncbi:FHA domain-containing protein [Chloroflexales bacterium ZM16-3]|nr:FHA domain-containing protein [Chloroflexales bacterium ZM16-3]